MFFNLFSPFISLVLRPVLSLSSIQFPGEIKSTTPIDDLSDDGLRQLTRCVEDSVKMIERRKKQGNYRSFLPIVILFLLIFVQIACALGGDVKLIACPLHETVNKDAAQSARDFVP